MQALRVAITVKINHYSNIIIVNITSIIKVNGHKKKTKPAYNYYIPTTRMITCLKWQHKVYK